MIQKVKGPVAVQAETASDKLLEPGTSIGLYCTSRFIQNEQDNERCQL